MIERKVMVVGDFAVGKTCIANKFFHGTFSEDYHADIGIKIYPQEFLEREKTVKFEGWDMPAEDEYSGLRMPHFRGASAVLLVADQTRSYTLQTALNLLIKIREKLPNLPVILAYNKSDLIDDLEIDRATLDQVVATGVRVFETSAKSGFNVNIALKQARAYH